MCLCVYLIQNVSSDSNAFRARCKKHISKDKNDYFQNLLYQKKKKAMKVQTYNFFTQQKRIFQRIFHIKKMEQKLSRGFFPFLQTSEKINLFLPSSPNWMQFIASVKLIFHWLAGSMGHGRQCESARLSWPLVLICGNWPGDMEPNQWKRRQRDREENQSLIAEESGVGGVKRK